MSKGSISYVVYGPMGCGKTRNKAAIARHLTGDPDAVVDGYGCHHGERLAAGKVHLTFETPNKQAARWAPPDKNGVVRFIRFSEVMADIAAEQKR